MPTHHQKIVVIGPWDDDESFLLGWACSKKVFPMPKRNDVIFLSMNDERWERDFLNFLEV